MMLSKEEKELLRKDLCARLPYGVKCQIDYDNEEDTDLGIERYRDDRIVSVCIETEEIGLYEASEYFYPEYVKPYLFPLSSITKEMMEEPNIYGFFKYRDTIANVGHLESKNGVSEEIYTYIDIESVSVLIEFFHSHHIDYRGLIEKGLAIDATGLDIYK